MKNFSAILLCVFAFFITGKLAAQNRFRGQVVAAGSHQPLDLATVAVAGGPRLLSDAAGHFNFRAATESVSVTISFIGYKTVQLRLDSHNESLVQLEPDLMRLQELSLTVSSNARFKSIARVDLSLRPVTNTQELLRIVPGLFIAQHAGGGKAEQIFLRGFDCDHGTDVSVGVDGMPVNMVSHAHGQGYADAHFIIPETVAAIDWGAGPYYAQQGDFTTAGYVQFSTYEALERSRIQLEGGRFGTARALGLFDLLPNNKAKQSAYIASEYYYTDGPTVHPQNFHRFNLFGKYRRSIGRSWLSVSASAFQSGWDASGQVPQRAVDSIGRFGSIDPSEGGNTSRQNLNLQLRTRVGQDASWENQLYASRYKFNLYSDFTFFLNDPVHGDELNQREERSIFGGLSRLTLRKQWGAARVQSVYAAGFRADATDNTELAHVEKRAFLNDVARGTIHENDFFAYSSQQWTRGRWLVEGALRYDRLGFRYDDRINTSAPSVASGILQPKLNLQYTINPHWQIVAKGGRGFHSNDVRVVVTEAGRGALPAAWGADLGLNMKPAPRLFLSVTAWWLHLQQEFVYVGDEGVVEPSGRTLRKGLDLLARYQLGQYFYGTANVNLSDPRSLDAEKGADHIPLAPTLSSTGGIYYKRPLGFNGGISYRYMQDRPANEDGSITARGYFLADLRVNLTRRRWELGLSVENLFNAAWNEAQFATESQLRGEAAPVTELHFTPGTPLQARAHVAVFF